MLTIFDSHTIKQLSNNNRTHLKSTVRYNEHGYVTWVRQKSVLANPYSIFQAHTVSDIRQEHKMPPVSCLFFNCGALINIKAGVYKSKLND